MILFMNLPKNNAVTMIELLAVLGVIAVVLAFLLPMGQGARRQYTVAQTKARFQRYALAVENFKFEYGAYPSLGASPIRINQPPGRFVQLMTGRGLEGGPMTDALAQAQNPDRLAFIQFSDQELTPEGLLQDPFGQTDLELYLDTDGDGFLNGLQNVRGSVGWRSAGPAGDFHTWQP